MTDKIVPGNVPKKYRATLIRFIETTGGRFGNLYYKPLRARIVEPGRFTTTFMVNLENGEICVPRKGKRQTPEGNLTLDKFFEKKSWPGKVSQPLTPPAGIYLFNSDTLTIGAGFFFQVGRGRLKLDFQVPEFLGLSPPAHNRHSIRSVGSILRLYHSVI